MVLSGCRNRNRSCCSYRCSWSTFDKSCIRFMSDSSWCLRAWSCQGERLGPRPKGTHVADQPVMETHGRTRETWRRVRSLQGFWLLIGGMVFWSWGAQAFGHQGAQPTPLYIRFSPGRGRNRTETRACVCHTRLRLTCRQSAVGRSQRVEQTSRPNH